jgi:DNA segregation ATPase FtsK/SpoIIIE-like protein
VGEQPNGTILTGDLADSSSAHLLIAGQTGSGKSVLTQSLIASLVRVKRLGAKARAAGIHMVLATQRPDRETIPSIIKANLGGKIALQVATQTNSRIVLDQGGAEKLLGRGDLLANLGRGLVRAQAPLISV